jgi:3'(2'), 5'-bisphosphate nucleotidase
LTDATTPPDLENLLQPVCDIARAAAGRILEIYQADFTVAEKQDRSPLTEADMASHRCIVEGLEKLTPDLPVLSEESKALPFAERAGWKRYWLVDPLDGTKEFIKKNGEFTVNIALIDGHEPVLGVVHVPVTETTYYAAKGVGCFRQSPGDSAATRLQTRKADKDRLVVSGSRSHGGETLQKFVESLPGEVEFIAKGSSLKLCLVAEGLADIYPRFGPTSEWDTAAAQCVVEQAGGIVVNLDFQPIVYNAKENILNPFFLVIADQSFGWQKWVAAAV